MDFAIVGAAIAVFTGVILALTAILIVARNQLVAQGDVTVLINDDPNKAMKVAPGQSLLSALASQKIFVPSACGGGGTCAMCKCQVIDGGGDLLPTESGHINMKARKEHWRLACQVKVKQDLKIKLPEEIFGIQKFEGTVISNKNVATFIKEFVVKLPDGVHLDFESGGYIQIDVPKYKLDYKDLRDNIQPEYHEDWDNFKVWEGKAWNDEDGVYRAYSMANHPAEGNIVMLNIRIATPPPKMPNVRGGICSSWIFSLKPGDKVTLSGPYGEFHIQKTKREMVYIGGGAGMAPLRSHLFHLFHTEKCRDRKISYWYGARSLREMFYEDEFRAIEKEFPNFTFNLALSDPKPEDNWSGLVGFIHKVLLDNYLSKHEAPEDIEYYLCGPPMMLAACRKLFDDLGVPPDMVRYDDFGG
jgi:Na+-transporting NADH:ubiquinone oxidoreductase subunit F